MSFQGPWFPPDYPNQTPNNSDDDGGYYNPQAPKYPYFDDYQNWVNNTRGKLSRQTQKALHNLIKQMPILRAEGLKLAGESVMWIRRKTSGQKCSCYNGNYDNTSVSKCLQCYGTTILGGYDTPIRIPVSFIPGAADVTIEEAGITVSQKPVAWTIITQPIIQERDIFVTFSNERYEILSPEAVEHQGIRHHQEVRLSRINKTDVKYEIPVPGIVGQAITDFRCQMEIKSPTFDIPATIVILNYYFNEDGVFNAEL